LDWRQHKHLDRQTARLVRSADLTREGGQGSRGEPGGGRGEELGEAGLALVGEAGGGAAEGEGGEEGAGAGADGDSDGGEPFFAFAVADGEAVVAGVVGPGTEGDGVAGAVGGAFGDTAEEGVGSVQEEDFGDAAGPEGQFVADPDDVAEGLGPLLLRDAHAVDVAAYVQVHGLTAVGREFAEDGAGGRRQPPRLLGLSGRTGAAGLPRLRACGFRPVCRGCRSSPSYLPAEGWGR
jgi:hypothetical protein